MNSITPKCECGCGKPLKPNRDRMYKDRGGYPHFINGHSSQIRAYKKRPLDRSYSRFKSLGWKCRQCGEKLPDALQGMLVCDQCQILLGQEFQNRKEDSAFRRLIFNLRRELRITQQIYLQTKRQLKIEEKHEKHHRITE